MPTIESKLVAIAIVCSMCFMGYSLMSVLATETPEYDLTIDDIPCILGDETLRIDTQTNDRGFLIDNDGVTIRSQYLTFYELNNSYEHDDINYVVGGYCYTPEIPAQNATLDTIIEINRFQLSSWNGTVTVQRPTEYSTNRMELTINSTDNATLLIRAVGLHAGDEYKVFVDGESQGWRWVNDYQYLDYNYTSDWSTHTVVFQFTGRAVEVPAQYLYIIEVMLCMGIFIAVVKEMILPLKKKNYRPEEITKALVKSVIFIVVGMGLVILVFRLFVGV